MFAAPSWMNLKVFLLMFVRITMQRGCCSGLFSRLFAGWSSAKVAEALGNKFMGVASFILLRLQCESSVSAPELMSHASALIDGYALSKGPAASRVIPLLNLSSIARRLPLPHLAAQSELHLAFALAAARKHVQVEEVRILLSF
jgi:hypothetical protein